MTEDAKNSEAVGPRLDRGVVPLAPERASLLRVAVSLPKPRLVKMRGGLSGWTCYGDDDISIGATPMLAYSLWLKHKIDRGAEIYRALRPFA